MSKKTCKTSQLPKFRDVIITHHAYQRYRDRVALTANDKEIADVLKETVKNGKLMYIKHDTRYRQYVLEYMGLEVLVEIYNAQATVITCYGYADYAKWYRRQEHFDRRSYCA